ncbi:Trehalose utilization [Tautonia plasticadhaerens]|uniref:Trehalose utilization n=2 Tax=Tautonia plasticadhaerens TaxID=2527974 RepID=A0A518GXN8_9BACT|nr:Trehalose utilization [Tautonia plasticadhaerens]
MDLCSIALLATLAAGAGVAHPGTAEEPLKVCLVSGSWEYDSEASLTTFSRFVEANYPAQCTLIQAEAVDDLPGLETLDECDVALFFTRRLTIDGDQLRRVKAYATSGRPIVGVRTASHGFQNWLEMDPEIFGGNYHGHYKNELTTEVALAEGAEGHPALDGFRPYTSRASLYEVSPLAGDCRVLLVGTSPEGREPLCWTRERDGGRVFYTSLGHQADFEEEAFLAMLADALFWAARGEPAPR